MGTLKTVPLKKIAKLVFKETGIEPDYGQEEE